MQTGVVRKRRPRPVSEYGKQLREKQDLKEQYNLREKQFSNYVKDVLAKGGSPEEGLMQRLERRLDNAVFRMGMAQTRKQSRQMVSHAHFKVNGKGVNIPSYRLKKGDVISCVPKSLETTLFNNIKLGLKKHEAPTWLLLNKDKMEAEIKSLPSLKEIAPTVDLALIFEFYSR